MLTEVLLTGAALMLVSINCWIVFKILKFYIDRTVALRDVIRNTDDDYCMCGDSVDSHNFGSGHAPVGMRSYYANKVYEMRIE